MSTTNSKLSPDLSLAFPFAQRRSRLAPAYELALRAIAKTHTLNGFPTCPVEIADRKSPGFFQASDQPGRSLILMSYEVSNPALDLLHQIGHAIDWLGLEPRGPGESSWPSANSERAAGWRAAVSESAAVGGLRELLTAQAISGKISFTDLRSRVSEPELFACCYVQWICQRSPTLSELAQDESSVIWPAEEFGAIASLFEEVLSSAQVATIELLKP